MACAALLLLGRHHPDIARKAPRDAGEQLDAGRVHAVVIAYEDARPREIEATTCCAAPPYAALSHRGAECRAHPCKAEALPGSRLSRPPPDDSRARRSWCGRRQGPSR